MNPNVAGLILLASLFLLASIATGAVIRCCFLKALLERAIRIVEEQAEALAALQHENQYWQEVAQERLYKLQQQKAFEQ